MQYHMQFQWHEKMRENRIAMECRSNACWTCKVHQAFHERGMNEGMRSDRKETEKRLQREKKEEGGTNNRMKSLFLLTLVLYEYDRHVTCMITSGLNQE